MEHIGTPILQGDVFFLLRYIQVSLVRPFGPSDIGNSKGSMVVSFDPRPLAFGLFIALLLLGTPAFLALLVLVMILILSRRLHDGMLVTATRKQTPNTDDGTRLTKKTVEKVAKN